MRRAWPRALAAGLLAGPWAGAASAAGDAEEALARRVLAELQPRSFAEGVEFCGTIGRDLLGILVAGEPVRGTLDACNHVVPWWMDAVASYHTHGSYAEGYLGELPSGTDMKSDRRLGIGGWIATPGGRLWRLDSAAMVARQVCGPGCLPADKRFRPSDAGEIAKAYTYAGLLARLGL